jgi:hypothetical protein
MSLVKEALRGTMGQAGGATKERPQGDSGLGRAVRWGLGFLIILAVILTLADEGLIVAHAEWRWRLLVSAGCAALDIAFTLLLAVRTAKAFGERRLGLYFFSGGGWIDFPAVIPLVFISGPFLFDATRGLQATAAILALGNFRLLRGLALLRFLRLLELFRKKDSERAAAIALSASLTVFLIAEGASILGVWPDAHEALAAKRDLTFSALASAPGADNAEAVARVDLDLLLVRNGGRVVYTRYSSEEYRHRFGPDEIGYARRGGVEAFFALTGELRAEAAAALVSGSSLLAILAALAFKGRDRAKVKRRDRIREEASKPFPPILEKQAESDESRAVGIRAEELSDEPAGEDELEGLLENFEKDSAGGGKG